MGTAAAAEAVAAGSRGLKKYHGALLVTVNGSSGVDGRRCYRVQNARATDDHTGGWGEGEGGGEITSS